MIHYRPNVTCLSDGALHDLREAWAALYALPAAHPHSWFRLAGFHGEPPPYYCLHGAPGFLTWHRAYLLGFEQALRSMNPNVSLPYWNWSSGPTTGMPAPCAEPTYVNRAGDTVPNSLYSGPMPAGGPAAATARRPDIATTTFGDLATAAQTALTHDDFGLFQSALNSVHGSLHVRVGGQMGGVDWAGYDPIFYLHHANVDRLWANWQSTHADPLPAGEASLELDPFTKPCSTNFHTGGEMVSTDALGYRYRNWCIIVIPIPVWEVVQLVDLPDWVRPFRRTRLVLRATRMAMRSAELRVFVNERNPGERTKVEGNPRLAARAGIFGMRGAVQDDHHEGHGSKTRRSRTMEPHALEDMHPVRAGERFDLAIDITDTLRQALESERTATIAVVAVDSNNRRVDPGELNFDSAEIQVE